MTAVNIFNNQLSVCKRRLLTTLLVVWAGMSVWAHAPLPPENTFFDAGACPECPEREFSRTINREFTTTSNGMTAIYNRHGQVNVKTWAQNKVKIDIVIIVNASDQREADRVFEKIQVNFSNASGYVKAETMIGEIRNGSWWNWNAGTCQDFKVNYEVWMPSGNQLDLRNKYGDAFVSGMNAKLMADIRYGDLRTENLNADADITIEYGRGTLPDVHNLNAQIGYGGITVDRTRDLQINTAYSDCTVRRAGNVRLTSMYDDLSFGVVEDLKVQSKYSEIVVTSARSVYATAQYTDLKIENVSQTLDANLNYGDLYIGSLSKGFQLINVVGNYTDMRISLERGAGCTFNLEGNYTDASLPAGVNVKKRKSSGSMTVTEGSVGAEGARGAIKAKLNYGDFTLR